MTLHLNRRGHCFNGGTQNGGCCSRPKVSAVRRRFANNTVHLTQQCGTCGAQSGQWLKADLYMPETLPWFDEDLQRRWRDRGQLRLPL
jgi:hypothetical protein